MASSPSYILTVPISSAILEALTSLFFEFILLCALSVLAQAICAHFTVRRLYDFNLPVKINSIILPLRVHAPVGHAPISFILALSLLLASLMSNALSFSINGRSEPILLPTRYNALVSFSQEVRPIQFNFREEFRRASDDDDSAPPLISERLRAIRMADQCLQCNYTHCTIYAYTINRSSLDTALVHPDEDFESTCVTPEVFRDGIVWEVFARFPDSFPASTERQVHLDPVTRTADRCDILDVDASFSDGTSFANATLQTDACNLAVRDAVCFKRHGRSTRCAALAPLPSGKLKVLSFGIPENKTDSAQIAWVTRGERMLPKYYKEYAGTVAYMDSLRLSGALYLLQRMATAAVEPDVTLHQRTEGEMRLLSDVDLRVASPGIIFNFLLLLVFVAVERWLWYVAMYSKGRQGINTMSSVHEVLAALSDEKKLVSTEQGKIGVAIARNQPTLSVQRSGGNTEVNEMRTEVGVIANHWDEREIL